MKKKMLCVGIGLGILAMASMALAGDFHYGVTLNCADCHTMHYSQQHGYNPDGGGNFTALADGPHEYLLRNDINDLCLSCHDGVSTFDAIINAPGKGTYNGSAWTSAITGSTVDQGWSFEMNGAGPYGAPLDHFAATECLSCHDGFLAGWAGS